MWHVDRQTDGPWQHHDNSSSSTEQMPTGPVVAHLLTVIKRICVEAIRPLGRAIRQNKKEPKSVENCGKEAIYVTCWRTDRRTDPSPWQHHDNSSSSLLGPDKLKMMLLKHFHQIYPTPIVHRKIPTQFCGLSQTFI